MYGKRSRYAFLSLQLFRQRTKRGGFAFYDRWSRLSVTSEFSVEQTGDYWLLNVIGEIDIATAPAFRSSLATWPRAASPHSIVDLSKCRYMDSTGISVLVTQRREDPTFAIVLPDEHRLQRLFHISGLDKILNIFPTREAALDAARDLTRRLVD